MACTRGKASPNSHTKLRLFAASGGYCQNPDCNIALFESIDENEFHIAEMAHIFSASDEGPRADNKMTEEDRGHFDNLILLCPTCHTKIDKAESSYPDKKIILWKQDHTSKIDNLFNVKTFPDRQSVRTALEPFLLENRSIFNKYGPETDEQFNPETHMVNIWMRKILSNIIPNNRTVFRLIKQNYDLLTPKEKNVFVQYKQHMEDFEAKHLAGALESGERFPVEINDLYK